MSRRPPDQNPINDFLDSQTEAEAREAIGAASQDDLDALENRVTSLENEVHTTIPVQTIMGNPGSTAVKPAPIALSDGGIIIEPAVGATPAKVVVGAASITGVIVGDTYLNGKVAYFSASRSDGLKGRGTLASPYNVSDPVRLDNIMKEFYDAKTPLTAMFLPYPPGIRMNMYRPHETWPVNTTPLPGGGFKYHPWNFYNGLRWRGFGKGITTFKPSDSSKVPSDPSVKDSRLFFSSSYKTGDTNEIAHFGDVQDCTFDAEVYTYDLPGNPSLAYRNGFNIYAGDFKIKNVEFINMGGRGQEMFLFAITNGLGGSYPNVNCNYVIEGCSSNNLWGTNAVNVVVHGAVGHASHQRALFFNNHFEENGITWATFNNMSIKDNFIRNGAGVPGKSAYCNINYDTGFSSGVEIIGNELIDTIAGGVCVGNITLGNWLSKTLGVRLSDVLIKGNTFRRYPSAQQLWEPGIILVGNVHNWNISDNFFEPSFFDTHFSKRGFVSTKGTGNAAKPLYLDDGTTPVNASDPGGSPGSDDTDRFGFGSAWDLTKNLPPMNVPPNTNTHPYPTIPDGGPQEANSEGIFLNNKLIDRVYPTPVSPDPPADPISPYGPDHGKTPLGMENKLMSALT